MADPIDLAADLRFTLAVPGHAPVTGALVGEGRRLELRVDDPVAFAARGDAAAVRGIAEALAEHGLVVAVVSGGHTLIELGETGAGWLQRRVTGSSNLRVASLRGAIAGARGRTAASAGVLPGRALIPPGTLRPLAPTFRRRLRSVTTTHDPRRGGNPRLVLTVGNARVPDSGRVIHPLRSDRTRIGSDEECEIRLEGLDPLHAEVLHDDRDEFVVLDHAADGTVRVNGLAGHRRVLRTGARVQVGEWSLAFRRAEYADHGRPYGGRIGGEAGHQRPQADVRRDLTVVEPPGAQDPATS